MADQSVWDEILRLVQIGDPVAGGENGPVNIAMLSLLRKILALKDGTESLEADIQELQQQIGNTLGAVLLKENNLSDVADKALARDNLDVAAADHSHAGYMTKAANLSDVDNKATSRKNLEIAEMLSGSAVPSASLGNNGNFYIRETTTTVELYKKVSGAWSKISTTTDISGNSATATKLKTARKISGVDFDGTKDITIPHGITGSTAVNGWVKFPSGLIFQWGNYQLGSSVKTATISYPISFPTAARTVVATCSGTGESENASVATIARTSFVGNSWQAGRIIRWFAIGY